MEYMNSKNNINHNIDTTLIDEWSEAYWSPLSAEDVRSIGESVFEFVSLLRRLDEKVRKNNEQSPANNN